MKEGIKFILPACSVRAVIFMQCDYCFENFHFFPSNYVEVMTTLPRVTSTSAQCIDFYLAGLNNLLLASLGTVDTDRIGYGYVIVFRLPTIALDCLDRLILV